MNHKSIRQLGQQRLQNFPSVGGAVGHWREFLANYQPPMQYPDDAYSWLTCTLALEGVASDNFGIGAILIDAGGKSWHRGTIRSSIRTFVAIDTRRWSSWRAGRRADRKCRGRGGLTLFSSLESCPMCLERLLTADVSRVLFAAKDDRGGMVQRRNHLPPAWLELARGKTFAQAQCSPEMAHAAAQIFHINLQEQNARLRRQ